MPNQMHPDKVAVTFRLHRDLVVDPVRAAAARRGEPVSVFVTRALRRELERLDDDNTSGGVNDE
jgi:hypothetical protein